MEKGGNSKKGRVDYIISMDVKFFFSVCISFTERKSHCLKKWNDYIYQ